MPFEIRGFSLPLVVFSIGKFKLPSTYSSYKSFFSLLLFVGILLTASSFAGYFLNEGGGGEGGLSSLGFVYGIPVFLIGKNALFPFETKF